ncbi:MAG: NAD(P)/FAD-dependent oxidoreductase [Chloroflexi bacterium]|nr:NAD(P)/FAD-dependent oxidoreductase [Chloroflexota bacterium]
MKKRVVIVGAGFAGINAARELRRADLDVLLIDRQNYHLFQPLLYQVATASLEQESIAYPARNFVRRLGDHINFMLTEVIDIDLDNKRLITTTEPVSYDYLILAAGARTNFFGNKAIETHAFRLKDLDDAVALRNHIMRCFERAAQTDDVEERKAWLSFVIVGGGPTGIEFAGALSELINTVIERDYPEYDAGKESSIMLVEGMDQLLPGTPKNLAEYARVRLEKMGVDVRLGQLVVDATPRSITLKDGTVIQGRTLLWAAGVKASPLADKIDAPKARGGRIAVNDYLSLDDHPDVFIVGDITYKEQDGKPLPGIAPTAIQMGKYAARAIKRIEAGEEPEPFHYFDRGWMAVIGRGTAVANTFGIKVTGVIAWLLWLLLHIFYLVGFRNRLIVMLGWAYDYVFFDRKVRLILNWTDTAKLPAVTPLMPEERQETPQPERM